MHEEEADFLNTPHTHTHTHTILFRVSLVIEDEDDDDNDDKDNQIHDKKQSDTRKKPNTKKAGYRAPYSLGSAN